MPDPAPALFPNAHTVQITNSSLIIGSNCRDISVNPVGLSENESHLLQIFNRLDFAHKIDFLVKAMKYESQCSNPGHALAEPNCVFTVL